MEIDAAGLRVLDRAECLALLGTATMGRIAVSAKALPLIAPVRFVVDGDCVVISIRSDTTLDAATRDTVVAFQAGGRDDSPTGAWSVHVTGIARHVTSAVELRRMAAFPLPKRTFGRPRRLVSISTDQLAGRARVDDDEPFDPSLAHSIGDH